MSAGQPMLVSGDVVVVDDILRLAAAHGVEVQVVPDADGARMGWGSSPLVLVGSDCADAVAGLRLARRGGIVLVTCAPGGEDWKSAVAVGAEHVVVLPEGERWLIDRLADCGDGASREGAVLALIGSGGGAGASTLAATLALVTAARALRVLLIDTDPWAGGLDVLLGIEDSRGIRWPDLAGSRGRLRPVVLAEGLPQARGVFVLTGARAPGMQELGHAVLDPVLDAGIRGFDLVVVDLPRHPTEAVDCVAARAPRTLIVTTPHVRSVAAVGQLEARLRSTGSQLGVVMRGARRGVSMDAIRSALPVPIVGRVPFHQRLSVRADEGEPPSVHDAYGRACQGLLATLRGAE